MALTTSTKLLLVLSLALNTSTGFAADVEKANLRWQNEASGNFLNYEWKDPTIEGETYLNSMLKSVLSYQEQDFSVKIGAIGLRSFGDHDKVGNASPWLQIALNIDKHMLFIMGSLETDHNAHEALIAGHRIFDDVSEEGFQLRYLGSLVRTDFWLNWHKRETQKEAEQFEVGSTNKLATSYLDIDLQFIAHHIDGQKTEDTTSLRNNIATFGGTLKLPTEIQPLLGARILTSSHKLNDAKVVKGVLREIFAGVNLQLPRERLVETKVASIKGHDFHSLFGLRPYVLDDYSYFEVSYNQRFRSLSEGNRFAEFGFRARAERFAKKNHSTQELTLGVSF